MAHRSTSEDQLTHPPERHPLQGPPAPPARMCPEGTRLLTMNCWAGGRPPSRDPPPMLVASAPGPGWPPAPAGPCWSTLARGQDLWASGR